MNKNTAYHPRLAAKLSLALAGALLSACGSGSQEQQVTLSAEAGTIASLENEIVDINLVDYAQGPTKLNFSITLLPEHGFLSLHGSNVNYIPDEDFVGTDKFEYSVVDRSGNMLSNTISFDIKGATITKKMPLKVTVPDDLVTTPGTKLHIDVTVSNSEGNVTHRLITPAHFGTILIYNGSISYLPLANFVGNDYFEIETISDNGEKIYSTIHIKVSDLANNNDARIQQQNLPAYPQLFSLIGDIPDDAEKIEWLQLSGPDAKILHNGSNHALIQTSASHEEIEIGLYVDNTLLETYNISPTNISHTSNPFQLSFFPFDPLHIVTTETRAFVFLADIGLISIDIQDLNQPQILGVYYSQAYPEDMVRWGDSLLLTGYDFLEVVSIENPDKPVRDRTLYIPDLDPISLTAGDNKVLVKTRYNGLLQINLIDSTINSIGVENIDGELYALSEDQQAALIIKQKNLTLLDLSSDVVKLNSIDTQHLEQAVIKDDILYLLDAGKLEISNINSDEILLSTNLHTSIRSRIEVFDNYLLVINPRVGAFVFNIENTNNIYLVGNFNTPQTLVDASIVNHTLTLVDDLSGLISIDLDSIDALHWSSDIGIAGNYFSAKKVDDYLYIGNANQGLQTLDISDPFNIDWTGSQSLPSFNYRIQSFGQLLFTSGRLNGLSIFDTSLSPEDPELINRYGVADARGSAIDGNKLVVANGSYGISFFDMDTPDDGVTIETDGYAYAATIYKHYALIANSNKGLSIFDISDIKNPQYLEDIDLPGWAYDVISEGDTAFVACGASGVSILDISDMENIELISRIEPAANIAVIKNLRLFNNELYVPASESGVFVYDVSNAKAPAITGHYNTPDRSHNLDVDSDFIYNVSYNSGLHLLDNTKPVLEQDYVNELAGSVLQYDVSWDSLEDMAVNCRVSAGSCDIIDIDPVKQTAIVEWQLGIQSGNQTLQVSVGNNLYYRASIDSVQTD